MRPSDRRVAGVVVGVLSDTHGHLYPRVREILAGVDHIIHAGDIGSEEVLTGLKAIAPVTAVRGNCDQGAWARSLPAQAEVELGGVRILVGHIAHRLRDRLSCTRADGKAPGSGSEVHSDGFRVVVSGHSHRMQSEEREGVLHLNPGSAGPGSFGRPRTVARLVIVSPEEGREPRQEDSRSRVEVEILAVD